MATYQGAAFIGEQLESIAKQTRLPDELVISDDGSCDGTLEIAEQFASSAPFRVRICRNRENLGFSRNFERAVAETGGDVVFLSDQDDIWFPHKIERVMLEFDRNPGALAVIHDQRTLHQKTGEIFARSYFDNQLALGLANRELVSGNSTAARRELITILQPFPDEVAHDFWIARVSTALDSRTVLREPLQLYRRHSSNLSKPVLAHRRPTLLAELLRMGLQDPRPHWRETLQQLKLAAARIEERSDAIDQRLGKGRVDAALEKLSREIRAFEHRIEVMSLPALRRRAEILRNWRGGFYDQFSGAKSAIRDLVVPLVKPELQGNDSSLPR
jgi:glycosyltransferase involved in cell wall biosynthesis